LRSRTDAGAGRLEHRHALRHEAATTLPVADLSQDGVIVAVIKEGYAIGDEVLRPASVVVGRHLSQT